MVALISLPLLPSGATLGSGWGAQDGGRPEGQRKTRATQPLWLSKTCRSPVHAQNPRATRSPQLPDRGKST